MNSVGKERAAPAVILYISVVEGATEALVVSNTLGLKHLPVI